MHAEQGVVGAAGEPLVSVIIPVRNGARTLPRCLQALQQTTYRRWEGIVVDDGSDDASLAIAAAHGFQVLPSSSACAGTAQPRNRGARQATGDILVFLDADVAVRPETIGKLIDVLQARPDVAACFGSYDATPAETNFLSQYKNLLHHYVHQTSRRDAMTFWAGCGAVRRRLFWHVGGFSERFRAPSVEDIDFGYRLRDHNYRIWLAPEIQVTHLKRWDARSLLCSDVFHRALPWSRLIAGRRLLHNDLNLSRGQRAGSAAAWALLIAVLLLPFRTRAALPAFLSVIALLLLNGRFYGFLTGQRGIAFTIRALPWHWFYFIYSSGAFVAVLLWEAGPRRKHTLRRPIARHASRWQRARATLC